MPNYKTHVTFNLFIALPIALAGVYYLYTPTKLLFITFISSFVYSTCFMNPDLDLIHQIKIFSLRGFLTIPFRFYSKIFKHRGLSHSALFGTATRIAWLGGVSILIFYAVYRVLPTEKTFLFYLNHYKPYVFYGLAGIVLADWCHLVLDYKGKFR